MAISSHARGEVGSERFQQSLSQALEVELDSTGCLDQHRLEGFVRLWLGRSRVPVDLHIVVRPNLQRTVAGVVIEIVKGNKRRERVFKPAPEDCAEVHAALGLIIALAIDANAFRHFANAESDLRQRWLLSASLAGGYDVLPGPSIGAKVGIEHEWLTWFFERVDFLSHYSPSNELGPSAGRYDAFLFAASLQPCMGGRLSGAIKLSLCSGAGIGALYVQGRNFTQSYSDTGIWIAVVNTLRAELKLGISWIIDFNVAAPLYAPTIHVTREDGVDRVQNFEVVGVSFGIGPAYRF